MAIKKHYPEVNPNPDFPKIEAEVLAFWEKEGLFAKSVDARPAVKGSTQNEFIFYDGPPFANGLPHYGHLLTGYVKDLFARYQTMKGKRVERRFGWDCHGLPAEMGSEKELGISGRAAITNYGIGKFNEHCRTSVMKYTKEWEDYVTRQARWVDFKNDYKTMDKNFMESVLWAFSELYKKGLVYEAYRVMPYSWAAETPLSNFETKLDNSYREREDKAITVAFELKEAPIGAPVAEKYYVLAWTTTPWTLPSNLALAVNAEIDYEPVIVRQDTPYFKKGECVILSKNKFGYYVKELGLDDGRDLSKELLNPNIPAIKGKQLLSISYTPLFPYFANHPNAFRIIDGSSFVTDGDGTGIVHIAPGFGEDDQRVAQANGIELVVPVDGRGRFTGTYNADATADSINDRLTPELELVGLNVIAEKKKIESDPFNEKQIEKYGLVNLRIIQYLKKNYPDGTNRVIKEEEIKHNYPHCWRTDQPLIYRAMPSWYVEVTKFRDRAVEVNKEINWIPEHIRDGQMGHMLATAPDWSISRNRFWGTPIPVWRSKSGKIIVCGSIAEIEKLSGKKVTDLHRPYIDDITFEKDGETYTRVEDVFDCWFESGSMPFAQVHYPFENKEWFEAHFPADFITEYVGQTRGWFNTLIMLSTALFDKAPFKNCICHGVVLDSETGLKYSKRLKNYKDPMDVMDKFGADALRWLMISSPVMRGMDLAVDPEGKFIRDVVRLAIKPIWNAYNFFCLYANADGIKAKYATDSNDVMDRYILAKCKQAVGTIENALDAYDTPTACEAVTQFFEALNNWYIRRNKERFWKTGIDDDKQTAYDTLYTVLSTMCRASAPLLPLTCDEIYKGLLGNDAKLPLPPGEGRGEGKKEYADKQLIENARNLRKNATDAEGLMWSILRDRQLENKKFRRQHPVGNYVLDFYCEEEKLAIELDGGQHADQKTYDDKRTAFLNTQGIRVLRFWNNDVLGNIEGVVETILKEAPSPRPSPGGRGSSSVHLADFPDVSMVSAAPELVADMDRVQDICNAALALRNNKKIRVRQPLKQIKIVTNTNVTEEWQKKYGSLIADIIKGEINVKEIGEGDMYVIDYATEKLSINNPILGKRLPEKMKQIIPASKKGEWKQIDGTVEICGEKLLPGEYTLQLEPKPEYKDRAQALSTNDALVILDTTITPELEAEGIARDLVRMIQQARKDAGFDVSDRITLAIDAPGAISGAASAHSAYIVEQTLAKTLELALPGKSDFVANNALDDHKVTIAISKCA